MLLCPLNPVVAAPLRHHHVCSFFASRMIGAEVLDCLLRSIEAFEVIVLFACEGEEVLQEVQGGEAVGGIFSEREGP